MAISWRWAYMPSRPELIWKRGVYIATRIKPTMPPRITRNKGSTTLPITACWCSISSAYCWFSFSKISSGAFTSSDTLMSDTSFFGQNSFISAIFSRLIKEQVNENTDKQYIVLDAVTSATYDKPALRAMHHDDACYQHRHSDESGYFDATVDDK